ncbi:MAG: sigma-54 dependent transcriptional regulator [Acidobacteriaceae bacterium]
MAAAQVQVLLAVLDTAHSASVAQMLMQAGATVSMVQVRSAEHLMEELEQRAPALLVLEQDRELGALEQLRTRHPQLPTILILAEPTEELRFAASRMGAEDIWRVPMDAAIMTERAQAVLDRLRNTADAPDPGAIWNDHGNANPPPSTGAVSNGESQSGSPGSGNAALQPPVMVGSNPRMLEIREMILKVAGTDVTVLVRGESGVGKEIVARLLFEHSRRRHKPFVKVNCAAIPHDLLESELFGYEAGAFTGAVRSKPGKFELADHGTLFLDEIAEMHPMLQAKLLHVLQDGRFSRLGAKRDISVDVRVVCATNKLLEERVREGLFREDLLYRINVVSIFLPPLRERRDEIPVITEYLLKKYAQQYSRPLHALGDEVVQRMLEYEWPGNIRELENLCKRFVIVGSETQILRELSNHNVRASAASSEKPASPESPSVGEAGSAAIAGLSLLEVGRRAAWQAERQAIQETLEATRWNRREASRRLQISYKALLNKIKQMQLDEAEKLAQDGNVREKSAIQ